MPFAHYSSEAIEQMEPRTRATLMNSLSGFKNASLIGTIDGHGHTNLALFSSVIHLGSNPALMGMIVRPNSVRRHTLENILEMGCFTINHVSTDIYKLAHQTAARYPKEISEFDATGLTPFYTTTLKAPYVLESPVQIGLSFEEEHELKINGTILLIARVLEVRLPEDTVFASGGINLQKTKSVAVSGLDSYYSTQLLSRLSYAKPDELPKELPDEA